MSEVTGNFDNKTFKELTDELKSVVSQLEGNTLELEDAVSKYKEGVALVEELNKRLENAKQQISYVDTMATPTTTEVSSDSETPF